MLYALTFERNTIGQFVRGTPFVLFITALILINAVTLGMETDPNLVAQYGGALHTIDIIILVIFTIEIALKFYAFRLGYLKSGWAWFDIFIVTIAWVPASGPFAVLRALRILRILRLISVVPQMRRVVAAIGHSIPGLSAVIGVLALVFYVSSVLATKLFGTHPSPDMQEWFGSISASAYTLFQIMTLESWSMGVVRPTMEIYPLAWLFFLPFIVMTSFAVLNFFIGIIVDSMQIAQKREAELSGSDEDLPMTKKDFRKLMAEIKSLKQEIKSRD